MRNQLRLTATATITACLLALALLAPAAEHGAGGDEPLLTRIRLSTIGTDDIEASAELYEQQLGYRTIEAGQISAELAASWDAPAMAGRKYRLLQSAAGDDVYLRLAQVSPAPNYRAMTTRGWNSTEILVQNPDAVYERLLESDFAHIGGPAYLGVSDTIRAVQFLGPSQEVFYFTADLGDAGQSILARAESPIHRPFIMVLAGEDATEISAFYQSTFRTPEVMDFNVPIALIARAQKLPEDQLYVLKLVDLRDFSNSIEIDGYPQAPVRERAPGELPPGVAIASFGVSDLEAIPQDLLLSPARVHNSTAYAGQRSATLRGPAGELIELIEERPNKSAP